jgi:hypothetical protein
MRVVNARELEREILDKHENQVETDLKEIEEQRLKRTRQELKYSE